MKSKIIEIIEIGYPQSLIQRENSPTSELIDTEILIAEINRQISPCNVYDPHESSIVKCDLCSYTWIAVRPLGVEKLECPQCGNMSNFEDLGT